jgi:uncharacterized membrane protein
MNASSGDSLPPVEVQRPVAPHWLTRLVVAAFVLTLAGALYLAPHGLLGAADGVGYAVCHRIDLRSFHLGDRALPLCARCTGTFLGAFVGGAIIIATGRGRRSGWPRPALVIVLGALILPWAIDGSNSYAALFGTLPTLYTPHNWLRLTPVPWSGSCCRYSSCRPSTRRCGAAGPAPDPGTFGELALYLAAAPVVVGLVLIENDLLYPASPFS